MTEDWLEPNKKFLKHSDKTIAGKKAILERLLIPNPKYFTIKKSEEVKGVALGIISDSQMGIFEVVINPNYRRKGAATILMNYMFEFANNKNLESIFLQVEETNEPALSFT